jgi:hypothetical protein
LKGSIIITQAYTGDFINCVFQLPNLSSPEDLEAKFNLAQTVSGSWQIELPGRKATEVINRYFAGHGEYSLVSSLTQLNQAINSFYHAVIKDGADWSSTYSLFLQPIWEPGIIEFLRRWDKYKPYLELLPFYCELRDIKDTINLIVQKLTPTEASKVWFIKEKITDKVKACLNSLIIMEKDFVR